MGLFKKDKETKPPKDDGSDKSWGQIIRDMPKMPTTRDMAQGTANAASFLKNMANAGDTSRLRSTGLKGTAVIHNVTDTGNKRVLRFDNTPAYIQRVNIEKDAFGDTLRNPVTVAADDSLVYIGDAGQGPGTGTARVIRYKRRQ